MPRIVSPGLISAVNTPWLAWLPELGCTLAKPQPNSSLARSIARLFGHVHILAAAVVALARIALGVFVGHHRALRLHHRRRHDVFRRDQLDLVALAAKFVADRGEKLGVAGGEAFR